MTTPRRSILAALCLLAVAAGCRDSDLLEAGAVEVDFSLVSLNGDRLGPQDFRGRVVLLDFWATWCSPCHLQADILASLYPEFRGRDVAFVAVSVGEPEATVRSFVENRPFPYPVLVDPSDRVSSQLGVFVLPTIIVLDGSGTVAYRHEGISSARRLRHVIEEILRSTSDSMAL